MSEHNALIGRGKLNHSYPHSWRSKAPLVFRTTPQWFISMTSNNLRDTSLKACHKQLLSSSGSKPFNKNDRRQA